MLLGHHENANLQCAHVCRCYEIKTLQKIWSFCCLDKILDKFEYNMFVTFVPTFTLFNRKTNLAKCCNHNQIFYSFFIQKKKKNRLANIWNNEFWYTLHSKQLGFGICGDISVWNQDSYSFASHSIQSTHRFLCDKYSNSVHKVSNAQWRV